MFDIKRREFIALLGGAAAWPVAARAQKPERVRRVGVLLGWTPDTPQAGPFLAAFARALRELGWAEGHNIQVDYRWAGSDNERIQTFAKELVKLQPDLIIAHSTPVAAALQRETKEIPIVFVTVSDPVGSGFVTSLPRPGGNMTGFINIESSLGGKWIELLRELAPRVTRAGLIFNPVTAPHFEYYLRPFEAAARSHGIEPVTAVVHNSEEIEPAIMLQAGEGGLAVMPDIFTSEHKNLDLIISLAARHRVPTIYPYEYMAAAGGLLSYGIDNGDLWRRAPTYIDRILKGTKASDLPVQLPTKFELAVNLKTARALGIDVPPTLLARADEVLE
jgi:putative tryptophan/tyrosine transport system substrate-binding protein